MERIGKYEILGELGQGGMGTVFKAHDTIIGRHVAIKVILQQALTDPAIKKRFYREARSAGRLSHDNITIIHDVGEENGLPYLVMELLDGSDLRQVINSNRTLNSDQKIGIAIQICRGLQFAHANGVIHRDIKPSNVRILSDGRVKIMDFGIARIQTEVQTLTMANTSLGTPYYMAPEQVRGDDIDHRADIFSFGVLLYELLTGRNPFYAERLTTVVYRILNVEPDPLQINPGSLSNTMQAIVSKCLAKDVDDRYADLSQVIEDLEAARASKSPINTVSLGPTVVLDASSISDETVVIQTPQPRAKTPVPTPPSPPIDDTPPASKKKVWIALAGVLTALLLAVGYFALGLGSGSLDPQEAATQARLEMQRAKQSVPTEALESTTYRSAVGLENDGNRAFLELDYESAASHYEEARDLFDEASSTPVVASDSGNQEDADLARSSMADAKQSVSTEQQQSTSYQDGLARETEGNEAYTNEAYGNAATLFSDAQALFEQAANTTIEPTSSGNQSMADRARTSMRSAKQGVSADKQQLDAYQQALNRERQADQDYNSRTYDRAASSYADAQRLFEQAANTTIEPTSSGNQSMADRARTSMRSAKQGVSADKQQLDAYQQALNRERQADQDYNSRTYDRAASSYADAQRLFEQAANTTIEPTSSGNQASADRAKSAMERAKSSVGASQQQSEAYQRGVSSEREGETAYNNRTYDRATSLFNEAALSFTEAAAAPSPEEEVQGIVRSLARELKTAFEREDLAAMQAVHAFYGSSGYSEMFNRADEITATVNPDIVVMSGTQATVDVAFLLNIRIRRNRQPASFTHAWTFERSGNQWTLARVTNK